MSRRQVLVLVALALAARMLYNAVVLGDYTPTSDADHYSEIATNVAAGDGFSSTFPFPGAELHPTAFRPPLYPGVLAAFYAVFGARVGVAQALNVFLGVGVVVLAACVARRVAGDRAGLVAGALVAVYPPLLANDGPPLAEPLSLCLMLGTVLLLLDGRLLGAGLGTGLLVLTKPSAQGVAVVIAAWLIWRCGWRRAMSFAVVVLLVVAPWIVRNAVVLGGPVLVTSNGFNLAALYSPESRATGWWVDPILDPRFEGVRRDAMASRDELELDAAFRRLAVEELRAHPWEVVETSARNAALALELAPARNDPAERADGRSLPLRYGTLWLVWAVTALGCVGLFRGRRSAATSALLICALYFTVISLPFSPMAPRLRAPLDVACCIGAGVALGAGARTARSDDRTDGVVIDLTEAPTAPQEQPGLRTAAWS